MDGELNYIIKTVGEKTGIEFRVSAALKERTRESADRGAIVARGGKTYFQFSFKGGEYLAEIKGDDRASFNYAYLLHNLLENLGSGDISLGFTEYLKKILLGECGKLQAQKFHVKFNVPDVPCCAMAISYPKKFKEETLTLLEGYSGNMLDTAVDTEDGCFALVKFLQPADQPVGEYAEFLAQSFSEELGFSVKIGVGTSVPHLSELNSSYRQALSALEMSDVLKSSGAVHSYKEYVLFKMLEDLPRSKLDEYFSVLTGGDAESVFDDPDMMDTAEEFLESSLNVSETARKLYMHRNTLIYRLDKIEKATGLNVKNFSDAFTFRVVTMLAKLLD